MSSKTVKFRRDSPTRGSYLDHQRSDSGVGSFSDSESRSAYPDRAFAGSDFDAQDFYELQRALHTETSAKAKWMEKAHELDDLLGRAHKELKEAEARMRALEDHLEELEEEKTKLLKTNKDISDEMARLKEGLKDEAKDKDKEARKPSSSSRRKSSSPPLMSGALNADEDKKGPRRSASKRHSIRESERVEREKERERIHRDIQREMEKEKERQQERDMDRLRRRFDKTGDESDARSSNTSSKSHRSRRDSYVEPLGQPAPRPQVAPPSPSRQYAYSSNPYPPQQTYQPSTAPRVSAVHPQVVVSYSDAFQDEEDGLYHPHPLPKQTRGSDRRR